MEYIFLQAWLVLKAADRWLLMLCHWSDLPLMAGQSQWAPVCTLAGGQHQTRADTPSPPSPPAAAPNATRQASICSWRQSQTEVESALRATRHLHKHPGRQWHNSFRPNLAMQQSLKISHIRPDKLFPVCWSIEEPIGILSVIVANQTSLHASSILNKMPVLQWKKKIFVLNFNYELLLVCQGSEVTPCTNGKLQLSFGKRSVWCAKSHLTFIWSPYFRCPKWI